MGLSFAQAGIAPRPVVGSYVELDTDSRHYFGEHLMACDDWDAAEFRIPVTSLRVPAAVNVTVTGRTIQRRGPGGGRWVRIRVTFVGDGEPNVNRGGWLFVG